MGHTHAEEAIAGEPVLRNSGAVWAIWLQTVVLFSLSTLPTPLYRDWAQTFHFGILVLTLIYATYVAGTLFTLLVLGRVSDDVGRARAWLPAILCAIAAAIILLLSDNVAMLFAGRFVTGIAVGLFSGTSVAWLSELQAGSPKRTVSVRTIAANLLGLGFGALLSGVIAEFAPAPLVSPFVGFLVLLAPLALAVAWTRETVENHKAASEISFRPRIGVPAELRIAFAGPAVITFVIFALVGFYSAIVPSLLARTLHVSGKGASGAVIFELFFAGVVADYATSRAESRTVMLLGAACILPTLLFLVGAQLLASLPFLLVGTALGGIALGTAYRGALEVTNALAPEDRRAELVSALFVCGSLGLAVPVIGVGAIAVLASPGTANLAFAGVIALLAVAGLAFGVPGRSNAKSV